jgi:hypothetical protein
LHDERPDTLIVVVNDCVIPAGAGIQWLFLGGASPDIVGSLGCAVVMAGDIKTRIIHGSTSIRRW